MSSADRVMAESLNRYLDGIEGANVSTLGQGPREVDPDLARAALTLRVQDGSPGADPDFAGRLLDEILANARHVRSHPRLSAQEPAPAPSAQNPRDVECGRRGPLRWPVFRLTVAQFSTAALLLLTIASSLYFFGPIRHRGAEETPAIVMTSFPVPVSSEAAAVLWESRGDPERPLDHPSALAIDPEGRVWVADTNHHGYQTFSTDGTHLESWGSSGSEPGQFNFQPTDYKDPLTAGGIAFAPDGSFYVADSGNARVQKFGPDRALLFAWGNTGEGDGQFMFPTGVTTDHDGRVFVADAVRNDIQVFTADGVFLHTIGSFGAGEGQLFLYSGGYVAADGSGNLWVTDTANHRLQKFSAEGKFLATLGKAGTSQGQFSAPGQVAIDADGRLFVADRTNRRVQVFNRNGTYLTSIGDEELGSGYYPAGVALDGAGNLYVSDFFEDRLLKLQLPSSLSPVRSEP